MCDLPEEELAEYVLWLEAARVRAERATARANARIERREAESGGTSELPSVPA